MWTQEGTSPPRIPISGVTGRTPTARALFNRKWDQVQPQSGLGAGGFRSPESKGGAAGAHAGKWHPAVYPPARGEGQATLGHEQVSLVGLDEVITGVTVTRMAS